MIRILRPIALSAALLLGAAAHALSLSDYPLLPVPQTAEFDKSTVSVRSASVDMPAWQAQWTSELAKAGITMAEKAKYTIKGEIVASIPGVPADNDEAYSLNITKKGIEVTATSEKGIYWALQTLLQLRDGSKNSKFPVCTIVDWPAFPWRGFMMDTGRSYISIDELKREINIM